MNLLSEKEPIQYCIDIYVCILSTQYYIVNNKRCKNYEHTNDPTNARNQPRLTKKAIHKLINDGIR